jgi:hypothetical protein
MMQIVEGGCIDPRGGSRLRAKLTKQGLNCVLPMELQIGDRLTDGSGEWEIIGRPYSSSAGKIASARVRRSARPTSPRFGPGARTSASA